MVDFYHSDDAENITHLFYGVDIMVYVEGVDDVPFWELIFNKTVEYSVEVQDVGGSKELEKYVKKIEDEDLQGIIACDSDFEIMKCETSNQNIVRTFGYAIENSLICPNTIEKVVKSVAKLSIKSTPIVEINNWINSFNDSIEHLVYYDIYNELQACGVSVMGDNCSKFLKSKNSYEICNNKVKTFIDNLSFELDQDNYNDIRKLLNQLPRTPSDFVRGHFLFSAVAKFVSSITKQLNSKNSLSNGALFGLLLLAFENVFNKEHPHYGYYKSAIEVIDIAA